MNSRKIGNNGGDPSRRQSKMYDTNSPSGADSSRRQSRMTQKFVKPWTHSLCSCCDDCGECNFYFTFEIIHKTM